MEFYIDVYSFDTFIIHMIILWFVALLIKSKLKPYRFLLGTILGTLYSILYVFIDSLPYAYLLFSLLGRILVTIIIILITYPISGIRTFIRTVVVFYLVNFLLAGGAFALFYMTSTGTYQNGVFYIESFPVRLLLTSTVISYIILKLSWNFIQRKIQTEKVIIPIKIIYNQIQVEANALVDTGNHLKDPLSQAPVIVVEFGVLKKILPDDVKLLLYENKDTWGFETITQIKTEEFARRVRLIPFSSLGMKNGMLFGFRPDKIILLNDKKERCLENAIVGIFQNQLSKDNHYEALLHPDMI